MQTVQLPSPTATMTPQEQLVALQGALTQVQTALNANATTPLCSVYQASKTNSTQSQTNSGALSPIPGYNLTIQSKGGLVQVQASISNSGNGKVAIVIDGNPVLTVPQDTTGGSCAGLFYSAVLGTGKHTISISVAANSGTFTVNPAGYSSVASAVEFPENVAS